MMFVASAVSIFHTTVFHPFHPLRGRISKNPSLVIKGSLVRNFKFLVPVVWAVR